LIFLQSKQRLFFDIMNTETDSILILGFSNCGKKNLINEITKSKKEYSKIFTENFSDSLRTFNLNHKIIDFSGQNFLDNLMTKFIGNSAIIIVSPLKKEFKSITDSLYLLQGFGVNQIIVVINKMDAIDYSEDLFNEISLEIKKSMKEINLHLEIKIVPISCLHGDNILKLSQNMKWYNGESLFSTLNFIQKKESNSEKPTRISIQDSFHIQGTGVVTTGRVESGILRVGDYLNFSPSLFQMKKVTSISDKNTQIAFPGDSIGFTLENVNKKELKRGMVGGLSSEFQPKDIQKFIALVHLFDLTDPIKTGDQCSMSCHSENVPISFGKLFSILSKEFGCKIMENPDCLVNGEFAIVEIILLKPIFLEEYKFLDSLGKFGIRNNRSIGIGIVFEIFSMENNSGTN
jgi:elongation factor 1-alpha